MKLIWSILPAITLFFYCYTLMTIIMFISWNW